MAFNVRSLLLVHFVSSLLLPASPVLAGESFLPAVSAADSAVSHHHPNNHFIILVHEGEDQDLICLNNGRSPNVHSLWLKNGVELENGEVDTSSSMQGQDSLFRSTLTMRRTQQSDNGIYTCILIDETGRSSLKTFDLLVTNAIPNKSGDLSNQTAITTIIAVMTALIILMAIATALTYRVFCAADNEQKLLETRKLSSTSVSHVPDNCFVLGTDGPKENILPILHV